jgi:hypothetical protein
MSSNQGASIQLFFIENMALRSTWFFYKNVRKIDDAGYTIHKRKHDPGKCKRDGAKKMNRNLKKISLDVIYLRRNL